MGLLADFFFALFTSGVSQARGRRRGRFARTSPPVVHVQPTSWLTAGTAAIAAQGVLLVAALLVLAWVGWFLATDDVLIGLVIIMGPVVIVALGAGLSVLGWMVGLFRKLSDRDAAARIELAVSGAAGVLIAALLALLAQTWLAAVVAIPSLAAVAVAVASEAWKPIAEWQ